MFKQLFGFALLLFIAQISRAITEDADEVQLRDASFSRERPALDYDMDEKTQETLSANSEAYDFNADVSRLMDIIINSLYTKKDVYIRELISNASDALDKARFISVSHPEFLGYTTELEVRIDFNERDKTLSITDTGVGMTKAELIKNLGTVAKSGTTAFLESMGQNGEQMGLIGQFGVGFYSAFLVANKVTVTSKSNDDEQHIWTSTADAKFDIVKDPRGDTLGRGTRVTLHLKDDALEYLEQDKIKNLVKKYSEFINYPIYLYLSKEVHKEVPVETPRKESQKIDFDDDMEIKDDGEEDPFDEETPKTKTVTEQEWHWELVNEIKAIWMREKGEISEEEYNGFYKTITRDAEDPLAYSHFSAEGEIEFKAILYIPSNAPFDMYDNYYGSKSSLKLYVRRVLISEDFEELMPKYLNFVKGVVDSDDLPLNVSREQLQQLKMIKVMSKKLVRKTIEMIKELAAEAEESEEEYDSDDDDWEDVEEEVLAEDEEWEYEEEEYDEEIDDRYYTFWKNFGKSIKLGVIEDSSNRTKLAKFLRFYSTNDPEELTSLDAYISRMKDDQDTILYLPGDSKDAILKNPVLKKYVKSGYEVLILDDPIDEFTTQHLTEYEKRKVKSIAKDDVNLLEASDRHQKKRQQRLKEMYKPLTDWFKKHLGKQVEKVALSQKLDDAPLYIFTSQYGFSSSMEKINKAQAFQNNEKAPSYMLAKKQLEINPSHPVMKKMLDALKESDDNELNEAQTEYADLMFNMALLNSGFLLDDPSTLTDPLERLIKVGFGFEREAECEDIEIEISNTEDDEEDDEMFARTDQMFSDQGIAGEFAGMKKSTQDSNEEFYAADSNQQGGDSGEPEEQNDNNNNQEEHEYISDDL